MVRGLIDDWSFPFFCDFNVPVTKDLYMQAVTDLEDAGVHVQASTCDQGPSNIGCKTDLGVTEDAPWIPNPKRPDQLVMFSYDWVHLHKSFRNNLIDHTLILENGLHIKAKNELQQLLKHCRDKEIGAGSWIKDIHLECKNSDRQTVRWAVEIMSDKTASLLREIYPQDAKKIALADIFDLVHKG